MHTCVQAGLAGAGTSSRDCTPGSGQEGLEVRNCRAPCQESVFQRRQAADKHFYKPERTVAEFQQLEAGQCTVMRTPSYAGFSGGNRAKAIT